MKLETYRHFRQQWECYDTDRSVCQDPECDCRRNYIRGWGITEWDAVINFTQELLDLHGIYLADEQAALEARDEATEQIREQHYDSRAGTY